MKERWWRWAKKKWKQKLEDENDEQILLDQLIMFGFLFNNVIRKGKRSEGEEKGFNPRIAVNKFGCWLTIDV